MTTLPRAIPPLFIAPLLLAMTGCGGESGGEEPVDLALTGVHVVDVVEGRILQDQDVLVDDGLIVRVGPAGAEPLPPAERVVEGNGRYLAPGLWDAHVHFRGGDELLDENKALLPLYVANGVTTVRDAGGDLTPSVLAWDSAAARGELVGPRIVTSGPKLDGPRPSWPGSIPLASPEEVPAALDSLEALGVDYVKVYDGSLSAPVFMAIVDEAEQRGLKVTGHMPLAADYLEAVERGFDAPDHLYSIYKATSGDHQAITEAAAAGELGFWAAVYRAMDDRDSARAQEVFTAMADAGMAVVPTLHIGGVLAEVADDDHQDDPELRFIDPAVEETYQGRVEGARNASPESRAQNRALRYAMRDLVLPLHEAGVTMLAGSDAGPFNSYVYPGYSLHGEVEALVEQGLTPAEALRAATVNPAAFLGLDGTLGQVAEGYEADLVLFRENPLDDITNIRTVDGVVLRGATVLDADDLRSLLESVARDTVSGG